MMFPPETVKELVETKIAFVERMGLKVLELAPGYVKLMAPLRGNENHVGGIYAGALFTVAEIPGGALFLTTFDLSRYYPIVKEMNIQFRRPAGTDVTIELSIPEDERRRIESDLEKNGKADLVLHGEIKDLSGMVVAVSKGTYQFRTIGS
jgi:acyl-coenzyme A thioesterase PaaI-like protein